MGFTFCIIDDERELCDILRLYFEARGHRCHVAHDGETGLDLVRKHHPRAVFLDLQMPRMNGFEVLTKLREEPAIAQTAVVLMTGLTQESKSISQEQLAKSANANAFLTKPFKLEELLVAVRDMLGVEV